MPVRQHRVRRKILGYLTEHRLGARFVPGAADTRLGVAHDARRAVDQPRLDQWPDREIRGGGVAAWIRNETSVRDAVAVKLGQSIDGLGEQRRRRVLSLVPS